MSKDSRNMANISGLSFKAVNVQSFRGSFPFLSTTSPSSWLRSFVNWIMIHSHSQKASSTFLFLTIFLLFYKVKYSDGLQIPSNISLNASSRPLSPRVVNTKYGAIRGNLQRFSQRNLQPIEVFMGIPYASPPVGKLRFMPPVTPAHWSGVRLAESPGPVCPQNFPDVKNRTEALLKMTESQLLTLQRMKEGLQNQSEDCLYLNIYTPATFLSEKKSNSHRLAVMVFIHGESYEWNAGSIYDGSILASFANVVVVTLNFRLGVLGSLSFDVQCLHVICLTGFFSSVDGTSRGNFGLMDQVAALHWIQENIRGFSGDPSNVTIFGHDFGAAFVNILMLTPMSKGLFKRAIMQSGSALCPWAIATDGVKYSVHLAKKLGCWDKNQKSALMVECLRKVQLSDLLKATKFKAPTFLSGFGPTVDGIVIASEIQQMMTESNTLYGHYHLLFGITKVEANHHFLSVKKKDEIDIGRRDKILKTFVRNLYNHRLYEIFLTIINEYTNWSKPIDSADLFNSIVEILNDALYVAPTIKAGLLHSKVSKHSYFYHLTYPSYSNGFRFEDSQPSDLLYTFGAPLSSNFKSEFFGANYTQLQMRLSEIIIKHLISFSKDGNPNDAIDSNTNNGGATTSMKTDKRWMIYNETEQNYFHLSINPEAKHHFNSHRMSYWLNLIPSLDNGDTFLTEHSLDEREDGDTYEGIVRERLHPSVTNPSLHAFPHHGFLAEAGKAGDRLPLHAKSIQSHVGTAYSNKSLKEMSPDQPKINQNENSFDDPALDVYLNDTFSMIVQETNYTTALSITIAIGCGLLILNILVFAAIFCQIDYHSNEESEQQKTQKSSHVHEKMSKVSNTAKYHCLTQRSATATGGPVVAGTCEGHVIEGLTSCCSVDSVKTQLPIPKEQRQFINTDYTEEEHLLHSASTCHQIVHSSSQASCNYQLSNWNFKPCYCQMIPLATFENTVKVKEYEKVETDVIETEDEELSYSCPPLVNTVDIDLTNKDTLLPSFCFVLQIFFP